MEGSWHVHQVRVTLFTSDVQRPGEPSSLWEQFSGSPPDTDEYVRQQNFRRQVGPFDDGAVLEMRLQEQRVDWHLNSPLPPTEGLPSLGLYAAVMQQFMRHVKKWLVGTPQMFVRIAFGPQLFVPVAGKKEGYQVLVALVPSLSIDPDSDISDLMYQINRPRSSKAADGLSINCVQRWNVGAIQKIVLDGLPSLAVPSLYHCKLDLDINTAPGTGPSPLESATIPAIFDEFTELAEKITTRGELG